MKLKYVGPHDAVDLVGVGTVKHGETVDVTGRVAESLTSQGDWKRVAAPKPRKPRAAAANNNKPAGQADETEE